HLRDRDHRGADGDPARHPVADRLGGHRRGRNRNRLSHRSQAFPPAADNPSNPRTGGCRMNPSRLLAATTLGTCVLLSCLVPAPAAQAQEMIPATHAVRYVGKTGMVCGTVDRTRHATNTEGEPTFLYMGGSYPRHTFSARIPGNIR